MTGYSPAAARDEPTPETFPPGVSPPANESTTPETEKHTDGDEGGNQTTTTTASAPTSTAGGSTTSTTHPHHDDGSHDPVGSDD